jgi:hypothetical protein
MTYAQGTALGAAVLGAVGTIILCRSSYAFRPLGGGILGSPALTEYNNRIKVEDLNRHR